MRVLKRTCGMLSPCFPATTGWPFDAQSFLGGSPDAEWEWRMLQEGVLKLVSLPVVMLWINSVGLGLCT